MRLAVLALVGLLLAAAVAVALVVLAIALGRRPAPVPSRAAEVARRHALTVHAIGWTLAVVLPLAVFPVTASAIASSWSTLHVGVLSGLLPALAGLAFLGVHALGERTWPRPTGMVRRAPLSPRSTADVTPPWLRRVFWTWVSLLTVTLVACGLLSDDGRRIARDVAEGSSAASPFPGWFYGVPLLVALIAVTLATVGALRLIARRPAVMDAAVEWDLGLRRLSAHRVLRGAQLVVGLTLAAVLLLAGSAAHRVGDSVGSVDGVAVGHSAAYTVVGGVGVVLAVAVLLATLAATAVPGRPAQTPAPEQLSPAPSTGIAPSGS